MFWTVCPLAALMAPPASEETRPWFNRHCAHYGKIDDTLLDYLAEVRPQQVQAGHFGPGYYAALPYARALNQPVFWTSLGGGPVDREWLRDFIRRCHEQNVAVIGHFSLCLTYGDVDRNEGFFAYFDDQWDEAVLGPKPPVSAVELMQRDAQGQPLVQGAYQIEGGREYWGCPNNPYWRAVLKAMVDAGLDLGLDGFMCIFPHRQNCVCEHCQAAFKDYLRERYTPAELREQYGIQDLERHGFTSINHWYEPEEASPYALECLKFSVLSLWECFHEVFLEHGRARKPDLIVAQWNHIYRSSMSGPGQLAGTFAQLNADERCTLPTELWSRDENYVWYSIGNWRMYEDLAQRKFSEFTLEHKYLYEAGGGKPCAVKKDDPVRLRLYIAEAVANGGFAYARGPSYRDAATREVVARYFDFLRRYESYYHPVESYAEAALLFPRRAVHRGDTSAIPDFKHLGRLLTKNHVLYDVLLEDRISPARLSRYSLVFLPETADLTGPERQQLADFMARGGRVVAITRWGQNAPLDGAQSLSSEELQQIPLTFAPDLQPYLQDWAPTTPSTLYGPDSVTFTVWRQPEVPRLLVHLVNYRRDHRPTDAPGAAAERPLPERHLGVRLGLPPEMTVQRVHLISPENPDPWSIAFRQEGDVLEFEVAEMLVYLVAVVE